MLNECIGARTYFMSTKKETFTEEAYVLVTESGSVVVNDEKNINLDAMCYRVTLELYVPDKIKSKGRYLMQELAKLFHWVGCLESWHGSITFEEFESPLLLDDMCYVLYPITFVVIEHMCCDPCERRNCCSKK